MDIQADWADWQEDSGRFFLEHLPCGACASSPFLAELDRWRPLHVQVCPVKPEAAAGALR